MTHPVRKLIALLAACALALGATACGGGDGAKSPQDVPADAIALVSDQEVPKAEFTALMARAEKGYKAQKRDFPKVGSPEYQDLKTRAIEYLVQRYQYRVEAEALGIEITDEEITKRIDQIKKQSFGGSDEKFAAELEKLGLTEDEAREEIRDRLIQEKIYDEITGDVKVTDEQVTTYYEKNEAQFTQPRQVRHILVKKKALADRLRAELEKDANFAALARKHSTDEGSAKQGGKLTVTKGQTVPEFDKLAFELDEGAISQPVKTQFGWHIIEALEPVKVTPLDDAKATIRRQLLDGKKKTAMESWVAETKRKYSGEVVYAVGYKPTTTAQQSSSQ
jgi:parvulin-like peptidyl-prolyl isomerase